MIQTTDDRAIDDQLIEALAGGAIQSTAATVAGCSTRTVQRRLSDPDFRSRLDETRHCIREEIIGRLSQAAADAVDVLHHALDDYENPANQIKAATTLLNSLVKVHSMLPKQKTEVTETREVRTTLEGR